MAVIAMMMTLSASAQFYIYFSDGTVAKVDSISLVAPVDNTESYNGHGYVDLGLPSGLKWATCNIGANTPEECGDYFAWGEVAPKEYYAWSTYKWCNGRDNTQTKYCTNGSYGTVDNKTVLEASDDAATVNWGGNWRMPTKEEQDELREYCTWKWIYNVGYEVIGPNGNSIFLPIAGFRFEESLVTPSMVGLYLSSSLCTSYSPEAFYIGFSESGVDSYSNSRYWGYTIRPVVGVTL